MIRSKQQIEIGIDEGATALERKLYKSALLTGVMGLLLIAVVLISKTAYPNKIFQVLAPIALLLIFISFGLSVLSWIFSLKKEIKLKNYPYAILLLLIGIVFVIRMIKHS